MKNGNNTKHASILTIYSLHTLLACIALLISFNAAAIGQLMVSPTRVVFDGNERSKQINIINNGAEAGRFRISFVRRNMDANGQINEVEKDAPGMFSDEMIRFSPRQVTLAPGQSQTIRLLLRKKSGIADGEYRSHMLFQALPDAAASDVNELTSDKPEKLTIKLVPVVGITIPVIVRQGELKTDVTLSDIEIKQTNTVKPETALSVNINRDGNVSTYGDFRVKFTAKGKSPIVIGQINGVAIYTSTDKRKLVIPLQIPEDVSLSNGILHVIYLEPGMDEKTGIIAEARLATP